MPSRSLLVFAGISVGTATAIALVAAAMGRGVTRWRGPSWRLPFRGVCRLSSRVAVPIFVVCLGLATGCKRIVELRPEQPATIRIGEYAALQVDSAHDYSVGSAGDAVELIKRGTERNTTIYLYRAAAPGRHTLVLTPRDPRPDSCVSCVTLHYFITVVK